MFTTLRVGKQGRLVIPADARRLLDLGEGDVVSLWVEDGRAVISKPAAAVARLRARGRNLPSEVSLVDELLSDRRAEAAREAGESGQRAAQAS
ncbi:MAG: AbrB/MazE/SpoVT family DNA-binding domain-containing protein [Candidatus Nanopelagicales bacterium]